MNTAAFFELTYGLYIVSSKNDHQESGCIINTAMQLTVDPYQICIALNKNNYTTSLIQARQFFHMCVLLDTVPEKIIHLFGFESGKNMNKFDKIAFKEDDNHIKYPIEHVSASFTCRLVQTIDVQTHLLLIGEVQSAEMIQNGNVLTYKTYQEKKKTNSFQQTTQKHGWLCTICGYVYEGDVLPENYICPICHVDASYFQKI